MQFVCRKTLALIPIAFTSFLFFTLPFPQVSYARQATAEKPDTAVKPPRADAEAIDKALDGAASFDFVDVPLEDVVSILASEHSIPIQLDSVAIEDAGYDNDLPMTGKGGGRPLRAALTLLFFEHDFIALIRNDTLLITTNDAIASMPEKYLKTKLYDITDLEDYGAGELIDSIQLNIDPNSWLDTNGGPATINELYSKKKIVLVLTHTSNHHYQVGKFLEKLRAIENSD